MDASQDIFAIAPAVAIESFGQRALALNCADLRFVELNATAYEFLSRLDGRSSLGQIAASMARQYGQPADVVLQDLAALVAQMAELGLVTHLPASATC